MLAFYPIQLLSIWILQGFAPCPYLKQTYTCGMWNGASASNKSMMHKTTAAAVQKKLLFVIRNVKHTNHMRKTCKMLIVHK